MQCVTSEDTGVGVGVVDPGGTEGLRNKLQRLGNGSAVLQSRNDSHAEPSAASNSA
jgi:hypothetical protein